MSFEEKQEQHSKILDSVAEDTNKPVSDLPQKPKFHVDQLPQKIIIAVIVIGIYGFLMYALFNFGNPLIFLLLLVGYFISLSFLLKGLKKLFKIKDKNKDI